MGMDELRKQALLRVARTLHSLANTLEKEFAQSQDEEEQSADAGYAPALCPSCSTYLDHEGFYTWLDDDVIIRQMRCPQCKDTFTSLTLREPMMVRANRSINLTDTPREGDTSS